VSALTFDLEWRTTLMTALLFPTLIALGFWQLERADEKARIAVQQAERVETPARPLASLTGLSDAELAYRKTIVSGYFAPDILMFLDNQIRDGRYGHDVYGVFVDEASGLASLINRGWVIGDASRRSLPQLEIPGGRQTLIASIYVPPGEPYLLAADSFAALDEPLLVQYANTPALRELIYEHSGYRVFPHELRLLPRSALGLSSRLGRGKCVTGKTPGICRAMVYHGGRAAAVLRTAQQQCAQRDAWNGHWRL
jgi:surfeit locus 1 family protein